MQPTRGLVSSATPPGNLRLCLNAKGWRLTYNFLIPKAPGRKFHPMVARLDFSPVSLQQSLDKSITKPPGLYSEREEVPYPMQGSPSHSENMKGLVWEDIFLQNSLEKAMSSAFNVRCICSHLISSGLPEVSEYQLFNNGKNKYAHFSLKLSFLNEESWE